MKNVVIAGATGAVGNEFLKLLEAREFPVKNLRLLASARSIGKKLEFRGEKIPVEQLTSKSFSGIDLHFFLQVAKVAKCIFHTPWNQEQLLLTTAALSEWIRMCL